MPTTTISSKLCIANAGFYARAKILRKHCVIANFFFGRLKNHHFPAANYLPLPPLYHRLEVVRGRTELNSGYSSS
ncbi:hypothetical protein HAX54_027334 [Datura stramonium]|uniref:Uncharacterized protein n=1 Tax=Datura stramonium TaxID=4076 RepID=A0ABS8V4X5_DATST|nr:hypothetical protein [Datura stramonium]